MLRIEKNKPDRTFFLLSLLLCTALLLSSLLFWDRLMIFTDDSSANINMDITREVVYPLFLAMMRLIFGSQGYLIPTLILQNLIAGFGIWSFCIYLYQTFRLPKFLTLMIMGGCDLVLLVIGRSLCYVSAIQTEALAVPLFFLLMRYLLQSAVELRFRPLIPAAILTAVGVLLRAQFLMFVVLLALVAGYVAISKKSLWKALLPILASVAVILALTHTLTMTYHYFANGVFTTTPFGNRHIATRMLYVADMEDAALFQDDPALQNVFILAEKEMFELGRNYSAVSNADVLTQYEHLEANFDATLFFSMQPFLVSELFPDFFTSTDPTMWVRFDARAGEFIRPLLADNAGKYLQTVANSFLVGVVRCNSFYSLRLSRSINLCSVFFSLGMYTAAVSLAVYSIKKRRASGICMAIVLVMILGLAAVPSLSLFPSTRYMFYAIGPFYAILTILAYEWICDRIACARAKRKPQGQIV